MAYSNGWNSTDQVAQRAIDQGIIGRFGSLDPTDGGVSSRFSLSGNWAHSSEYGQTKVSAYVDPLRRCSSTTISPTSSTIPSTATSSASSTGAPSTASMPATPSMCALAGIETQTRVGLQTRDDDIHVGLFKTLQRDTLSTVREDRVQEGNVGLWADTTARWTDWLRTTVGIREDFFAGRVLSDTPENSGNAQASMTSPKAGIVLGPWYKTEFYGNAGYGLHSNDIRGATITVDPNRQGDAAGSRAAAGAVEGRRARHPHQGDRRTHQFARGVRARFRFGTAVRRRCRHHRGQPAEPARRRRVDQQVQAGAVADVRSGCRLYPRPLYRFRSRRRPHPRRAGLDRERCGHLRQRDRLVRRAEGTLFRSASADRGRQRSFAVIADLQCARRLQIRQRPAAAARRA